MSAPTAKDGDPYLGQVFGNVKLTARIARGGMGMVYKGVHERFDKDVAVKLLLPQNDEAQLQFQKRFLREGQAAARINHPNFVQVMDAGTDRNVAYLVLEYVEGASLGDILEKERVLDPERVRRMAIGVAEGLQAIHDAGVVHRDLKPDNLLVGADDLVKITDLGLARQMNDPQLQRLTATGMVVGTPLYVAPESIRDTRSAGPKSDIYGLGATLYHCLTGHPPFLGKTPFEVMTAHLEEEPQAVCDANASVPRRLGALIDRCLAKDPDKRPNARQLAALLRSGAGGGGSLWWLLGIGLLLAAAAAAAKLLGTW